MRPSIKGQVRFIFQPAEEKPPGGARPMIENGALKKVAAIFGLHVDPNLPVGTIGLRDGPTMAAVYDFHITIHGRGGHAARPQLAVDAITTAAEVIESVQKVVSRETDPISPVVITFGRIEGGTARNIIADRVWLAGTARTLSAHSFKKVPALIRRTVKGVCHARGATFELSEIADYPILVNDPQINRLFAENHEALVGKKKIAQIEPTMGGEDFACYLQKVPGATFRLGARNKKIGADKSWHSPEFIVDEAAMLYGTALLAASAIDYLGKRAR
jgi:amidohydrolase